MFIIGSLCRFQSVLKQSQGSSSASMAVKVETLKNELEQAENRVQQCRVCLTINNSNNNNNNNSPPSHLFFLDIAVLNCNRIIIIFLLL